MAPELAGGGEREGFQNAMQPEAVGQPAEMGDPEGGSHRHQHAGRTLSSVRVRIRVIHDHVCTHAVVYVGLFESRRRTARTLDRILFGFIRAQLVYVMARLRLADLIGDCPRAIDELSAEVGKPSPRR
jgi:hypothetical protein